jgi:hypothetical protein
MGNLQVRFLEGWAPAMAPGYSTFAGLGKCHLGPPGPRNFMKIALRQASQTY